MSPNLGTLCVVGLGHAGWPLAVTAAEAGFRVTAIDRDPQRLQQLRNQREAGAGVAAGAAPGDTAQNVNFGTHVTEHHTYLVCVPTPVHDGELQSVHLCNALQAISKHLKRGALVVIVSTVPLGFTEGSARQLLEQASGLSAEDDFLLGYAAERFDPGTSWSVRSIPRVLAGTNARASAAPRRSPRARTGPDGGSGSGCNQAVRVRIVLYEYGRGRPVHRQGRFDAGS